MATGWPDEAGSRMEPTKFMAFRGFFLAFSEDAMRYDEGELEWNKFAEGWFDMEDGKKLTE